LAFERAASELRVPLKIIKDSATGGREKYRSRLILVRPDQFVAWAGNKAEATHVLRCASGGPERPEQDQPRQLQAEAASYSN
jgi:4-hydroxyisophthalate hydroxylase